MKNIYLIGMMSSGKSTVGKALADRLGKKFFDTDEYLQESTGELPRDIIANRGSHFFSEKEFEALNAAPKENCVVSAGGKTYLDKTNRDFIDSHGVVIFINTSVESITKRLTEDEREKRGIRLAGEELSSILKSIYEDRMTCYRSNPNMIEIEGGEGVREIVDKIIKKLKDTAFDIN
jgi:shikimate kinase